MEGFDETTYGEAFADIYDDWYAGVSSVEDTVGLLSALAGGGPVLELGVGTGRLAVPLARAGHEAGFSVVGVDTSPAMLAKLAGRDVDGLVRTIEGDMVHDLPPGPFTLAFVAYNTLFNLTARDGHAACFDAVAERLVTGGRFVVEAFVPDEPFRTGDDISIRSMTRDRLVLSVSRYRADGRSAEGQFVEITEAGGVRLRPWAIRYATVDELDTTAASAGFSVEARYESFDRSPFGPDSPRHVSVYRKN